MKTRLYTGNIDAPPRPCYISVRRPHGEMAERLKATVSKTVRPLKGLVSSNLTLSATTISYRATLMP